MQKEKGPLRLGSLVGSRNVLSKIVVLIFPGQDGISEKASPVLLPHALPLAKSQNQKFW